MRYGSVCSGIEAATAAWHPLGWEPAFFSEIEKFPRAVLQHHYPDVPLHGDFTTIGADDYGTIDLLVGGTPCQSFSVAGLRKGMDDDRGNLALEYLKLAQRKRPTWLVWENVPGVLSSNGGRDFGAFLGGLVELGYGFAYRVLDAQYFGVAQRRRRVFVVGHLGDWRAAAAVLFERHSLQRHPAPRRKAQQGAAPNVAKCLAVNSGGIDREDRHTLIPDWPKDVASSFDANYGKLQGCYGQDTNHGHSTLVGATIASEWQSALGISKNDNICPTLIKNQTPAVAGTLTARHDSSPCHDRGMSAAAFTQNQRNEVREVEVPGALAAEPGTNQQTYIAQGVAIRGRDSGAAIETSDEIAGTLRTPGGGGSMGMVHHQMAVRRLTPVECERLQGFPDNYTAIPWRGKGADKCPDGPRYKALGNSMAVPVMRWIGERIDMVAGIICPQCHSTGKVCCGGQEGYFECCQRVVECENC